LKDKPILCLDFDGVIHSYSSGWQGARMIPDPPVKGALRFLNDAQRFFKVAIYSSRSGQEGGLEAMQKWLKASLMERYPYSYDDIYEGILWPTEKPPAFLTIDDRAMRFEGHFPNPEWLTYFKPWNKSGV